MIYGIGVSLNNPTEKFIATIKEFPTAVIHAINGIVSMFDLQKLYGHNLKLLILGYKRFGRGVDTYQQAFTMIKSNQQTLYGELPNIMKNFKVVSFDNLAIEQLSPKRLMSEEEYDQFYMGDDGSHTMYIDLVKNEFAINSVAEKRYPLLNNIDDMFEIVKGEKDS